MYIDNVIEFQPFHAKKHVAIISKGYYYLLIELHVVISESAVELDGVETPATNEPITAKIKDKGVSTTSTFDRVIAGATVKLISAASPIDPVVASIADHPVFPGSAVKSVSASAAEKLVVADTASEYVVSCTT